MSGTDTNMGIKADKAAESPPASAPKVAPTAGGVTAPGVSNKPTPGPWLLGVRMSTQGFWQVLGKLPDGSNEYCVASVIDANDRPENAANARLIAAAPELLEALEELLAAGTTPMPPFEAGIDAQNAWGKRRSDARDKARAAIAKVRP